jgi:hypothetical protein
MEGSAWLWSFAARPHTSGGWPILAVFEIGRDGPIQACFWLEWGSSTAGQSVPAARDVFVPSIPTRSPANANIKHKVPFGMGCGRSGIFLHEPRLLRNLCRRLKADSAFPLSLSRHSRAGLSYAAASRLTHLLSHQSFLRQSFVTASNREGSGHCLRRCFSCDKIKEE